MALDLHWFNAWRSYIGEDDQWAAWFKGNTYTMCLYIFFIGMVIFFPPLKDKSTAYFILKNMWVLWLGFALNWIYKDRHGEIETSLNEWRLFIGFVIYEIINTICFYFYREELLVKAIKLVKWKR